jgi:hypothetical protein
MAEWLDFESNYGCTSTIQRMSFVSIRTSSPPSMCKFGLIPKFIECYRLHGLEGLAPLFASEQQRDEASPVAQGPA